jgi:hypothetical protein
MYPKHLKAPFFSRLLSRLLRNHGEACYNKGIKAEWDKYCMPTDDIDDKYKKKKLLNNLDNTDLDADSQEGGETGGESGEGGISGAIQFHDFTSTAENIRDDLLSFEQIRRLISNHKETNEFRVKGQKEKRDQYKKLKEGKIQLQAFRERERAAGRYPSQYVHPVLANKSQFSGIDKQVNMLPNESVADTNNEKREELRNELRHRLGLSAAPKFNPKPQGPGY